MTSHENSLLSTDTTTAGSADLAFEVCGPKSRDLRNARFALPLPLPLMIPKNNLSHPSHPSHLSHRDMVRSILRITSVSPRSKGGERHEIIDYDKRRWRREPGRRVPTSESQAGYPTQPSL